MLKLPRFLRCAWGHPLWQCECGRIQLDLEGEPQENQPEPQEPQPADAAAQLEAERAERLRLEGEVRQLREQVARSPENTPKDAAKPQLTAEEVQKALDNQEITQAQAARLFARIEARQATVEVEAEREQHAALAKATDKIAGFVRDNPELKDRNSPLMRRVAQELRVVETDYGMNPEDPRAQVLAIERVLGPKGGRGVDDDREYDRLRRAGGMGEFQAGGDHGRRDRSAEPKSRGERIFNQLLPEFKDFYISLRGSKEAAIKTLDHADEAQLRKAGRLA